MDHHKLWEILQEMGIPDHLTCLLRNLYARQKATVRTGHGPMDWVKIGNMHVKKQQLEPDMDQWTGSKLGKECVKAVYCHPAYLTYTEYIMRSAGLDEVQAGIKIAGKNINNLDMQMTPPLWQKVKRN